MASDLARRAYLAWWLGPWAPASARPRGVTRRALDLDPGGPSYLYRPVGRPIDAVWLLAPGLHHEGPDEPRMDRFAAVLAGSGALVLSPRSDDLCRLRFAAGAIASLARAFDALIAQPEARGRPVRVASISIGSLAALRLASDPATAARVERVVVIGGYVDPVGVVAALCGADGEPRDPLNQPVPFLTFLDHLPADLHDRDRLVAAWTRFVHVAWSRPAWKEPGATFHHALARELAGTVDARDRHLFLLGCGVEPGGHALCQAAMATGAYAYLDPRDRLAGLRADVIALHGTTDTVVPVAQLDLLAAAIPSARTIRLAGFGHARILSPRALLALVPRAAAELRGFARVVRALA